MVTEKRRGVRGEWKCKGIATGSAESQGKRKAPRRDAEELLRKDPLCKAMVRHGDEPNSAEGQSNEKELR